MARAAGRWLALLPALLLAAMLAGCTSIGVQRVGIDRTDYNCAHSASSAPAGTDSVG